MANPKLGILGKFNHISLTQLLLPQTDETSVRVEAGKDFLRMLFLRHGKNTFPVTLKCQNVTDLLLEHLGG